jgi:hypothetical protein
MSQFLDPPDAVWHVTGRTVEVRYRLMPDMFVEPIFIIVEWPANGAIPTQALRTVEGLRRRWGR